MERIEFTAPLQARWRIAEEPTPYGVERRPRVYLDTSIPSYVPDVLSTQKDVARRQRITDVWWRRYRERFELYISSEVEREAKAGGETHAQRRMERLLGIKRLPVSLQSRELASLLVHTGVLPIKADADATHIAIAAVNDIEYLLTWNCKHMANPFIARRVVQTCEKLGFRSPKICTPEVLMRACRHERSYP